jgi:hypothetical protein
MGAGGGAVSAADFREALRAQLEIHGAPTDERTLSACVTAVAGHLLQAQLDREQLQQIVHAVEATVPEPPQRLRWWLDEAYENGVRPPGGDCECSSCTPIVERVLRDLGRAS